MLNLAKHRQGFFRALGTETEEQTNLVKNKVDMVTTIKQHQNTRNLLSLLASLSLI